MDEDFDVHLIEGAEVHDWDEKDEIKQAENINQLALALAASTSSTNKKQKKQMLENTKEQWRKTSDEAIDFYVQVTKKIYEIKQKVVPENKQSWKIFLSKVQPELERLEDYAYLDMASFLVEMPEIKYIVKCLNFSGARLEKFLNFLTDFEREAIDKKTVYNEKFEMLMNLEFKLQNVEPDVKKTQELIKKVDVDMKSIETLSKKLKKKTREKFYKTQAWLSSSDVVDLIVSLNFKINEQKNIIKKMRKSLYKEGLVDFAGQEKFSKMSNEEFDALVSHWLQVPQNISAQIIKITDRTKEILDTIENLQNEMQFFVDYDEEKKSMSVFAKMMGKKPQLSLSNRNSDASTETPEKA